MTIRGDGGGTRRAATQSTTAVAQLGAAIEAGRPDTAPPLVALHEITASVLRTKIGWRFALDQSAAPGSPAAEEWQRIAHRCVALFGRARDQGALAPDADLEWARRVYYALIGESVHGPGRRRRPRPARRPHRPHSPARLLMIRASFK